MNRFAIRLLTLAMYATAIVAVPMVAPAKAAAEDSKATKRHKKASHKSPRMDAPMSSTQAPRNMSDDPDRKVGY